jgi:hypothetical protein
VVNVKPADRLRDPKIAAALAWPEAVFRAHGWDYEVWSSEPRPVVENVRFLAGYRRPGLVEESDLDRAWSQVVHAKPLGDLERRLAAGSPGWTVLLALLWRRWLETDLRLPLSAASIVWRCRPARRLCSVSVSGCRSTGRSGSCQAARWSCVTSRVSGSGGLV